MGCTGLILGVSDGFDLFTVSSLLAYLITIWFCSKKIGEAYNEAKFGGEGSGEGV